MKLTDEMVLRVKKAMLEPADMSSATPLRATCVADALAAFERVQMPGDCGEFAKTQWAAIEREGGPVQVFVQHWEDPVDFTDEALTELAYDLLALREIAARSRAIRDSREDPS